MRILKFPNLPRMMATTEKLVLYHLAVEHDYNYTLFYVQEGIIKYRKNKDPAYKGIISSLTIPKKIFNDSVEFAQVIPWLNLIGIREDSYHNYVDSSERYRNYIQHNSIEYKKYHFKFKYSKDEFNEFERICIPETPKELLYYGYAIESLFCKWKNVIVKDGNWRDMKYPECCKFLSSNLNFINLIQENIFIAKLSE